MKNLDTAWACAGEEVLLQIILSLLSYCCSLDVAYRHLTTDTQLTLSRRITMAKGKTERKHAMQVKHKMIRTQGKGVPYLFIFPYRLQSANISCPTIKCQNCIWYTTGNAKTRGCKANMHL